MAGQSLTFLSWSRPAATALATGTHDGRVVGAAPVTLTTGDGRSSTSPVAFTFTGPADIAGLAAGAIVRRYPAPGATDHESDRCPYIELADPTLPWRYTPAVNPGETSAALHPWFVLVVGEPAELTIDGTSVTIAPSAQIDVNAVGAPNSQYRFAHVQIDANGHRVARVLCGRRMQPGMLYRAVVVAAFDGTGAPAFTGQVPVTLDILDSWEFITATPAGSFEELAAALHPGHAPETLGSLSATYQRIAGAEFTVRGALIGRGQTAAARPDIKADLASLTLPDRDPAGRPIVRLPRYGDAWSTDATTWANAINADPTHRSIAGLGLEVGIQAQESLIDDVLGHLGDLQAARERIRYLVLGLTATRSLWQRRVPTDPIERLWMLGPATGAVASARGSIRAIATADERALPTGVFSAAARRVLRRGPARSRGASTDAAGAKILAAANLVVPRARAAAETGMDESAMRRLRVGADIAVRAGAPPPEALRLLFEAQADSVAPEVQPHAMAARLWAESGAGFPGVPAAGTMAAVLAALAEADVSLIAQRRNPDAVVAETISTISRLATTPAVPTDGADLVQLAFELYAPPATPEPAVTPVTMIALANAMSAAFNPLADTPPAVRRVLPFIDGAIDPAQSLAPPEVCVGLRRPAWLDARSAVGDFLLPGVVGLDKNAVVAVTTNPAFIEAFLLGLNTQLLAELRWRNIPIATGCTPIRRFWDRIDVGGTRVDDITGIAGWPAESDLGDPSHGAAMSTDLVVVIRGDLFNRYPATLVSLVDAVPPGETSPNFDGDPHPSATPLRPTFFGRLSADTAFFGFPGVEQTDLATRWVVLEEPPAGYRFANDAPAAANATAGHDWATAALAMPARVLIRGTTLVGP